MSFHTSHPVLMYLHMCPKASIQDCINLRQALVFIAVAGSVDAGKSSLVGVLTHGIDGRPLLDNGCGSARMNVFQHKHEIETGRTSSLTHQMLGYDEEGQLHAAVPKQQPACMLGSLCPQDLHSH